MGDQHGSNHCKLTSHLEPSCLAVDDLQSLIQRCLKTQGTVHGLCECMLYNSYRTWSGHPRRHDLSHGVRDLAFVF